MSSRDVSRKPALPRHKSGKRPGRWIKGQQDVLKYRQNSEPTTRLRPHGCGRSRSGAQRLPRQRPEGSPKGCARRQLAGLRASTAALSQATPECRPGWATEGYAIKRRQRRVSLKYCQNSLISHSQPLWERTRDSRSATPSAGTLNHCPGRACPFNALDARHGHDRWVRRSSVKSWPMERAFISGNGAFVSAKAP